MDALSRLRTRLKKWDARKLKSAGVVFVTGVSRTSLPEILFVSTFIISHYLPNADFSYPYELVLPIALFAVLISIFFYTYRYIFGRVLTAHIASLPLAYYLYHYADLSRYAGNVFGPLLPDRLETAFTMSLLALFGAAIVFGTLAFVITKLARYKPELALDLQITKIALFIVAFNFAFQAVVLGNFLFQARHQLAYDYKSAPVTRDSNAAVQKPDIYYLVFDRYTGAETLKDVYDYDNSDFLNFLKEQQFVTRDNAYANYPYTMASISSTLAMNYEPELGRFAGDSKQTGFPYRSILNNPPVVDTLKQNGYQYNLLSSWWDFARIGVKADREPTKSFSLHLFGHDFFQSDFSRDTINRSVLSPLLKKGIHVGNVDIVKYNRDNNPKENFESQMAALKDIYTATYEAPQFTFAHVLLPHDPYIFSANGSPSPYNNDRNDEGADEYVKYRNQVIYANTRIKELVSSIKSSDPNAVIILQSDEGPYPKEFRGALTKDHYYDPKNLPVDHMKQKMSILASYYLPGADQAEVASNMTSNVNAFRFVLSHYMGYDLPPLPDCHLSMGNKFSLFSYTLLNKQLTGKDASKECAPYL